MVDQAFGIRPNGRTPSSNIPSGHDGTTTTTVTRKSSVVGVGRAWHDWRGGESEALRYLCWYIWEGQSVSAYVGASDSMHPGEKNAVNSTTRLSPWLAFGCLSPRYLIHQVRLYETSRLKAGGGGGSGRGGGGGGGSSNKKRLRSTYWIYHEQIFRDFFRFSSLLWKQSMFKLSGPYAKGANGHTGGSGPAADAKNSHLMLPEAGVLAWRSVRPPQQQQKQQHHQQQQQHPQHQQHQQQQQQRHQQQRNLACSIADFTRWATGTTGYPFIDAVRV